MSTLRRFLLVVFFVSWSVWSCAEPAEEPSALLVNGSFEKPRDFGDAERIVGWDLSPSGASFPWVEDWYLNASPGKVRIVTDGGAPGGGEHHLYVESAGATQIYYSRILLPGLPGAVTAKAGENYRWSLWAKGSGVLGVLTYEYGIIDEATGRAGFIGGRQIASLPLTPEWKQYEGTIETYRPNAKGFSFVCDFKGSISLDNVVLRAEFEAAPLAQAGTISYVIMLAESATPPERTAANELATYLKQVTGAEFAVVKPADAAGRPVIAVGPGAAKVVAPNLNLAKTGDKGLGDDGIVLKTVPPHLVLTGAEGAKRGTLYAVYEFLEREIGVRWWSSNASYVPKQPVLNVPALNTVYVPKLKYREAAYLDAFDGVYAARSRYNGHWDRITPEYGDHYRILGWSHTFFELLPPDKYFKAHPEWYSESNGTRVNNRQLCLSNADMRRELTRNALEWIRKDPEAGIISISQNDFGGGPCQCAVCRAFDEREGSPSGLLVEFVNQVAADIEKEYPNFLIETLAYAYTTKPPKSVRPRGNVIIRLCISGNYAQPLETGVQNEIFRKDIEAWSALAPQLFIWDYPANFTNYILPHPNLHVLAPNIRFFVKNKTVGLFELGDRSSTCGDFVEMRAWLLAHLMWDPSRDEKALITEFLNGYYGAAAQPLQAYLDLMRNAVERSGTYLTSGMPDTSTWLSAEDLVRATALFDAAAQKVKDDPVLNIRVRRARMPLDHAWLQSYPGLKRAAALSGRPFILSADPAALCSNFINSAHEFNAGDWGEGKPFMSLEAMLRRRFLPAAPKNPPAQCAGLTADDWIDVQDNEFLLYQPGVLVDDASASDSKAAWMPGSSLQWAVQFHLADYADLLAFGPWHCYIVARCQVHAGTTPSQGAAFQLGLLNGLDSTASNNMANLTETLTNAADGAYRTYDLGVHDLKAGMYFWAAPMGNADEVDGVFVDRVFLIREKALQKR